MTYLDEPIDTREYKGYSVKVYPDEFDFAENPRDFSEPLGVMSLFHKQYDFPNEANLNTDDFTGWQEMADYLYKEKDAILLADIYMYEHSQIHIKIGDFYGQLPQGHARFDSGQIGFIYTTREKILETYQKKKLTDKLREKARHELEIEVQYFNDYASGHIYHIAIENEKGEQVDAWTGIYETDLANHIDEAKGIIDNNIKNRNRKKCERTKSLINNRVELIYR